MTKHKIKYQMFCFVESDEIRRDFKRCYGIGLKVNVMAVNEESTWCEIMLNGDQLKQISEFKYQEYNAE